ncbi:MAG: alanine--tRNA ligase [Flavobacteriales bacterium]|nr:alanine--tRNA ligase [Flavobacteriales bacterium]
MTSTEVRNKFLEFFKSKEHRIVPSAPIVVKNDPTLMFTNAGMNQFKDYFLGNKAAKDVRVADTQKCLRVSGKHNDLEEVGVDTYHHTMFEMLGNWSFGDYFKKEAIAWAWELLTEVYKLDKTRLYVTVFEGDEADNLLADTEAEEIWKNYISADRILRCNKKDNFWEMGDTGPCGACSEIHYDLRSETERKERDGKTLVNADHPQVIELWNLVFMEFNRKADKTLEELPDKHVDTGMGLERVVRAIQLKNSNYDTDLFMNTIIELEKISGKNYGFDEKTDIAFRVIADHIRALSFCVADGQLPSNGGAGYVIRRILRRAVRYGYSYLCFEQPFLFKLVEKLASQFADIFPELNAQKDFVARVIEQEEVSFLRTLNSGLSRLENYFETGKSSVDGQVAFELYDTFGFPIDLTQLIAAERGMTVDMEGFQKALAEQKARSKADAAKETGDWNVVFDGEKEEFVGYDFTEAIIKITRYRTLTVKGKEKYQLVFNVTPFYAESGGQVGDTGLLTGTENNEKISVVDTQKENDLIVHIVNKLPENFHQNFEAKINLQNRENTAKNHSATHLVHAALRLVLGDHVAQKGSLVDPSKLRFDFSHFSKMTDEEIAKVEEIVNEKIAAGIELDEKRNVPYDMAIQSGVTALFGEKYGDVVRVITFGNNYSKELCGGTHVQNTSHIGRFKLVSETSVAAGVRRIEAITGDEAERFYTERLNLLSEVEQLLGNPSDLVKQVQQLLADQKSALKKIEMYEQAQVLGLKKELMSEIENRNGIHFLAKQISASNPAQIKDLLFQIRNEVDNLFAVLVADIDGKPSISIMISDNLVKEKNWNAGQLIRDWSKHIKGGGGGQPFFAQAGGSDVGGLPAVIENAQSLL